MIDYCVLGMVCGSVQKVRCKKCKTHLLNFIPLFEKIYLSGRLLKEEILRKFVDFFIRLRVKSSQ